MNGHDSGWDNGSIAAAEVRRELTAKLEDLDKRLAIAEAKLVRILRSGKV